MSRRKSYTVAGREFARQADLESTVKAALNSHQMDVEFEDSFLAAVVNELHPDVIDAGQRVVRFLYMSPDEQRRRGMPTADRFRGGAVLTGYFEPIQQWHDVTVYPWRKPSAEKEVKAALRDKISPHLPRPRLGDHCAECPAAVELEYDHVAPTFDLMATVCLAFVAPEELATRFGYSKFTAGTYTLADFIPGDHPAVVEMRRMHTANTWRWACKRHHRNVGA